MPKPQLSIKEQVLALQTSANLKCKLSVLPVEVRGGLADVLDDPVIQHVAISKWLRANGFDISPEAVSRHRRRDCRCPQ